MMYNIIIVWWMGLHETHVGAAEDVKDQLNGDLALIPRFEIILNMK